MGAHVNKIQAVERDVATGRVKLVGPEGKHYFMATSLEMAERLALLLGVDFVPIPISP
jgi:hypothetical protein